MGNPILQLSEKSLRYLCTVVANEKVTDLTNSEECGVHCILGNIVFTRGTENKNDSFSISINSIDLYEAFGLLFTNLSTRGSFVVLRPVFYNGFSNIVPDMVRVYVRTTAVDANFDKRGLQVLERMCAEQVFSESLSFLSDQNKIVIETSDILNKGVNGWSHQFKQQKQINLSLDQDQDKTNAGKILVSQRTSAAQNKSDITIRTHGSAKLSAEQRISAEAMLNAIITSGYKESPRSLAFVPWIEVSESVVVNTRTWSLERNPLFHVPLTKIQNVSRSEYTERFSDTLGFLLCPRGCGRRRTISACFSMLNSSAHDSENFVSTRKKSHTGSTYLSLSTCLIVCKDESIEKWEEELQTLVDVLVLRTIFDLEKVTKENIVGKTLLLSRNLLLEKDALFITSNEIISEISGNSIMLQFPLKLSDDRVQKMYVSDIVERFGQSIIPLQWIHFRCVLYDDTTSTSFMPPFSADWTWISHVTDSQMGFIPPQTLLRYAKQFWSPVERVYNRDFLFKWRLLHGEGCVIPFVFPKAILHKVILKTQKVQISRQENLFLSVVKSLAEQQLGGKVPFQGILKNSDYLPILLGCDAFDAKGCSLDLAMMRKQPFTNTSLKSIESNLHLHFAQPSSGTTFAQKLMGCNRLKLTAAALMVENLIDRGGSKFVLESLQKSSANEAVCGVCYCDPVEVFCLCGHGYCKTCTEIFSRANTLIVNCPTCRLPLCPFDWISFSAPAVVPTDLLNFSAFGGSYQATSANNKTLSRICAISSELNLMFKTRSKHLLTASAGILVAPEQSLQILKSLLMSYSDSRQYTFEIGFPDIEVSQNKIVMNPEDEDSPYPTPPSTPRSLNKLVSDLSSSQIKKRFPRIFIVSFEALMSINVTRIDFLITGLIFATPPPAKFSQCYINATRIASANSNRLSHTHNKNNNLNLVVLYTTEFEEDDMIMGRKVLKREEAEPKPRSHSNSFSGSAGGDKSPRR